MNTDGKIKIKSLLMATAATAAAGMPVSGFAQEAEATGAKSGAIEEIVVTAQKREEKLEDVPLSLVAVTGATLERANVTDIAQLPRLVPNMNITQANLVSNLRMSIRGVGTSGNTAVDPSIGTFVDGIYVPRPGALVASFNDIAGVEVLRGPQGTLFGRNSTAGGILFRTNDPGTQLDGSLEAQAGNYGMQKYAGTIDLPASDKLSFRAAGLYDQMDGYAHDRYGSHDYGNGDTTAGRVGRKWDILENLKWTLKFDYSKIGGDGAVQYEIDPKTVTPLDATRLTAFTGGNPPDLYHPYDLKSNQRIVGSIDDHQWGVASNLAWDLAGGYSMRLLGGYRHWQDDQVDGDVVFLPLNLVTRTDNSDSKSQSYELQLISPVDKLFGGRLDYVAGLYYFQEDFSTGEDLAMGSDFCTHLVPAAQRPACNASGSKSDATHLDFSQNAKNYAIYSQANFRLLDPLTLVLGGRWTKDEKSGSFLQLVNNPFMISLRSPENTPLNLDDDYFTYRAGLNWKLNPDLMLFTSYSTGYKSGGFNSSGGTTYVTSPPPPHLLPPIDRVFKKETSNSLEAGVKSTLAGGTAHLNATLYRQNLQDFQDRAFDGVSFRVLNAGNLLDQGVEADGDVALGDHWRFFAAFAYLDAYFTKYPNGSCLPYPTQVNPKCTQNLKDATPTYSPEYTASGGAQVEGETGWHDTGFLVRSDLQYVGAQNVNAVNDNNPQAIQPAVVLLSARASLLFGAHRNYSLSAFGDNLTGVGYCSFKSYQTLNNSLGLNDPLTGGSVMRCGVAPPRTLGLAIKAKF